MNDEREALAKHIEESMSGFSRAKRGHASMYLPVEDYDMIVAALRTAPAATPTWHSNEPVETAPQGERILLCWDDDPSLTAHVELGKRTASGVYSNTYGKAFTGRPTHWMRLPSAISRPSRDAV